MTLQGRSQKYRNHQTVEEAVDAGYDLVQPKWDGHFAEIVVQNGRASVYGRTGTLMATIPCPGYTGSIVLLGEYLHGTQRAKADTSPCRLVVFDCVADGGYRARCAIAASVVESIPGTRMAECHSASIASEIWQSFVVDAGGEGLVFRRSADGWRSSTIGRVKSQPTLDYVVISVAEGDGRNAGRMGAISCGLYEENILIERVSVGGGWTDTQREQVWDARDTIIGSVVEVRGYSVFASGSMRHPQFSRWRPDKRPEDCVRS